MVRNQQHCSILDSIISLLSILHCQHQQHQIFSFSASIWCSSRFCPLLFILYTTPLSHIISRSSVNHKLYADDTQLFPSFSPCNFQQNIQLLQNTIFEISSWMASNFLSLNSSKTEFLLIGLPTQLTKIDNPFLSMPSSTSIKPVASARNLGVIFDSNLSFSDHISYISKTCFVHIRDLRRIRNTLDHTTACTVATSLIHSKLDYCNSLFSESQLPANKPTTTYSQLCCSCCH